MVQGIVATRHALSDFVKVRPAFPQRPLISAAIPTLNPPRTIAAINDQRIEIGPTPITKQTIMIMIHATST